ncbi:MAG: hypothetical protein ACXQTI_09610, partial [Candidatus Nezhaarchaeales archaeon]
EALYTSQLLRTAPEQRMALIQQGYAEGVFDDEDMQAFQTVPAAEMEGLIVDKLRIDGYGELLPAQYQQDAAGKFGRLQAAVDAEGNPVFIQTSGTGETREVEGYKPVTIAQKEDAKTAAMVKREKVLDAERLKIENAQAKLDEQKLKFSQQQAKQEAVNYEMADNLSLAESLLSSDLSRIYGKGEKWWPELIRSQEGIDLIAQKDRFVSVLQLAQAGKLKGQGQVSDGERKILREASTALSNPNISPDLAKDEISRAIQSIERTMGVKGGSSTRSTGGQSGRAKRKDSNVVKWGDLP